MTEIDKDNAIKAYEEVRSDDTETNWTVLKYNGSVITVDASGVDFNEFLDQFSDDDRAFGFIRIETGDEMSKRKKFALITFIGTGVGALKRAKVSTDKAIVKKVFQSCAVEFTTNDKEELNMDHIKQLVVKAGGANYGTGSR